MSRKVREVEETSANLSIGEMREKETFGSGRTCPSEAYFVDHAIAIFVKMKREAARRSFFCSFVTTIISAPPN